MDRAFDTPFFLSLGEKKALPLRYVLAREAAFDREKAGALAESPRLFDGKGNGQILPSFQGKGIFEIPALEKILAGHEGIGGEGAVAVAGKDAKAVFGVGIEQLKLVAARRTLEMQAGSLCRGEQQLGRLALDDGEGDLIQADARIVRMIGTQNVFPGIKIRLGSARKIGGDGGDDDVAVIDAADIKGCLLYTSPSPRD